MTDNPTPPDPTPADIDAADEQARQLAYLLKAVVRELSGGWNAWASDSGVLYAIRDRGLSDQQVFDGLARTVYGDTPRELVERIRAEISLEADLRHGKAKTRSPAGL